MTSLLRIDSAPGVRSTSPVRDKPLRTDSAQPTNARKGADSFTSTFQQVSSAIEAGDLAAAKEALDGLGTRGPAYTRATPPGRGPAKTPEHSNSRWNRQIEFQALVDAVRGEQLTGAQEALTALRTPGLQRPTPAAPPAEPVAETPIDGPVDTPVAVGGDASDVPVETLPVAEETVAAEPPPEGALTDVLPPSLETPPVNDAALVELLTEPTTQPVE